MGGIAESLNESESIRRALFGGIPEENIGDILGAFLEDIPLVILGDIPFLKEFLGYIWRNPLMYSWEILGSFSRKIPGGILPEVPPAINPRISPGTTAGIPS